MIPIEETSASARLLEMLNANPRWPTEKKGLCTEICRLVGDSSYASVRKWLYSNSLPRTPEERKIIADKLGVDLIYWEYGIYSNTFDNLSDDKPKNFEPIHYLKHANAVLEEVGRRNLVMGSTFTEQALLKIQEICIENSKRYNTTESDRNLINNAIDLFLIASNK